MWGTCQFLFGCWYRHQAEEREKYGTAASVGSGPFPNLPSRSPPGPSSFHAPSPPVLASTEPLISTALPNSPSNTRNIWGIWYPAPSMESILIPTPAITNPGRATNISNTACGNLIDFEDTVGVRNGRRAGVCTRGDGGEDLGGFFSLPLVFSCVAGLGSAPVYLASFSYCWVFPLSIGGSVRGLGKGYVRAGIRVTETRGQK